MWKQSSEALKVFRVHLTVIPEYISKHMDLRRFVRKMVILYILFGFIHKSLSEQNL